MLATGLIVSALAGALGTASADHTDIGDEFIGHAYLPWVPNGEMLGELGPYHGTVTVQNLETSDILLDVYVGVGTSSDNYELAETLSLRPNESQTLSAATLEIPEPGASVYLDGWMMHEGDEDIPARIAAVAKNTSPVSANNGLTTSAHVSVDGYSALTREQVVDSGAGTYVLPITQTNDGWDTMVRVANFNSSGNGISNVTVTLYGSGGQGFAGQSQVVNLDIRPGGVGSFLMSDYVDDGWVGSAFITSGADIGAIAERYKVSDQMLITNTSRPEHQNGATQYAPLVFKEYNYWNTGISVANTDPNNWNSVTITYYGPTMNQVGQDTLTIPPRGQEFVYTPGGQDLGLAQGFVGSARITGSQPFHAVVDQVKYFGDDPDVGQAMSYVVEDQVSLAGDMLAMPLVQKGNPNTGTGDTSGIQLFNTSASARVNLGLVFYGANGLPVAPTVINNMPQQLPVELAPHQSYTLYTHRLTEMSQGFRGSLVVEVTGGDGGVVGVSNNVNYAVNGDGSTAFTLVRVEPRAGATLLIEQDSDLNLLGEDHEVTATLLDQFGHPMAGQDVTINVNHDDDQFDESYQGETDPNGQYSITYSHDSGAALGQELISAFHEDAGPSETLTKTWDANIALTHIEEFDGSHPVNDIEDEHLVLASVTDVNENPVAGVELEMTIEGANSGASFSTVDPADGFTDASGQVTFGYSGEAEGIDTLYATIVLTGTDSNDLTKEWVAPLSQALYAGAGDSTGEGTTWDSPFAAIGPPTEGGQRAAAINVPAGETTQLLELTGYGFSIPADATITGIGVTIYHFATGTQVYDDQIQLLKAGVPAGDNYADGSTEWPAGAWDDRSYGGEADLWGTTWTPAEVNAAEFGIGIRGQNNAAANRSMAIDAVEITVYYEE